MRWGVWTKVFGHKAEDLSIGGLVYFRRGNLPALGKVVAAGRAYSGNELRVPLMLCNADGRVSTRRTYWRNRSQLYVRLSVVESIERGQHA